MKKLSTIIVFTSVLFFACSKDQIPENDNPGNNNTEDNRSVVSISIVPDTKDLYVGEIYVLKTAHTPSDLPAPSFNWESSDESIVSVDQRGEISALAEGSATITISSGKLVAKSIINVHPVLAKSIELSVTNLELYESEKTTIVAKVFPQNATEKVVWDTEDSSIVSITKEGLVQAKAVGETRISASCGSIQSYCSIKVEPIKIYENSVLSEVRVVYPGTLHTILSDEEKNTVQKLKITGAPNETDFTTIRVLLTAIESLDLGAADVTIIPKYAFSNNAGIKSIILPQKLTYIDEAAFSNCLMLESISIPANVTEIGIAAFKNCLSMKRVEFAQASALTRIGGNDFEANEGVFFGCMALTEIILPPRLKFLGGYCFSNCNSLIKCVLPENLESLGAGCFSQCTTLQSIELPNKIKSLPSSLFYDCESLSEVSLPANLTYIRNSVFRGCKSLTTLSIPDNVTEIENAAFASCTLLRKINLPSKLTHLTPYLFEHCTSLEEIDIPMDVKSISYSFSGCSKLSKVICRAIAPPAINELSFANTPKKTLFVPQGCEITYKANTYWSSTFWGGIFPIEN